MVVRVKLAALVSRHDSERELDPIQAGQTLEFPDERLQILDEKGARRTHREALQRRFDPRDFVAHELFEAGRISGRPATQRARKARRQPALPDDKVEATVVNLLEDFRPTRDEASLAGELES